MTPMMPYGPLLERLLAGQFICVHSQVDDFRHLQNPDTQAAINHYLRPLNRRLASTADGQLYFLAYEQLTSSARQHLSQQLQQSLHSLLPVLEWLQLVQEALGHDSTLYAGDTLKMQEFILKTDDNQNLRQRLHQLANDRFFNSQSDALDNQVKLIFKRLKEHGYLLQPHSDRHYFVVTGKIDYLMELIRFIKDEEQLPIEISHEAPSQEALL